MDESNIHLASSIIGKTYAKVSEDVICS